MTAASMRQANANNSSALVGINNQQGIGVDGYSYQGTGVRGESNGGIGVYARSFGAGQASAYALKTNNGNAVWGVINAPSSAWAATVGSHNGSGPGVLGENTNNGRGVWGRALGSAGAGVFGESTNGRGGMFKGKKAQVQLMASTAASHPPSGAAGDLFVDVSKRLWFRKGGTNWVQLA